MNHGDVFEMNKFSHVACVLSHLVHSTFHTGVRDHTKDAGFKSSVKRRHGLMLVNRSGTCYNPLVGASLLKVQSDFQHLRKRDWEFHC